MFNLVLNSFSPSCAPGQTTSPATVCLLQRLCHRDLCASSASGDAAAVCYLCFSLGSTIITILVWVRVFVRAKKRVRKVYLLQIMFLRWILFIFSRQYLLIKSITNKHTHAGIDRRRISWLEALVSSSCMYLILDCRWTASHIVCGCRSSTANIRTLLFAAIFIHFLLLPSNVVLNARPKIEHTSSTDNSHTKIPSEKNWWNLRECGKCVLFSQIVCERVCVRVGSVLASFVH